MSSYQPYPPHYAYPSAPPLQRAMPNPPRLHWALVLVFSVMTLGFFGIVWLLVQSVWSKKMRGKSTAMVWAIVYVAALPVVFLTAFCLGIVAAVQHADVQAATSSFDSLVRVLFIVLYLVTVFTLRSELEAEPIGIPLGGGMTFFFSYVYFQYHLSDYGKAYNGPGGQSILPQPGQSLQPPVMPYPPPYSPGGSGTYPPNYPPSGL